MKKILSLIALFCLVTVNVMSQTYFYFVKPPDEDKVYTISKLQNGIIYYNDEVDKINWTQLAKYDNSYNIMDLDEVLIMKYKSSSDNNFICLTGSYMLDGKVTYDYTDGFNKNETTAVCQFCGGQIFLVELEGVTKEGIYVYYIKTPPNYYYEYTLEQIRSTNPVVKFFVKGHVSKQMDFATIFFLMKFSKGDVRPCQ